MDQRATKILFSAFWSPQGWKRDGVRGLSEADIAYAKTQGVLFDPVQVPHDELVQRALRLRGDLDAGRVVDAFVSSLGSRDMARRSALGSYAVLSNFPEHNPTWGTKQCEVCGTYARTLDEYEDLNVLSFERLKWGGVRHLNPLYATFDLEQFAKLNPVTPTTEDVQLLKRVFEAIETAPTGTTSASLQSVLPKELRSNKAERDILIGILGFCGILETISHQGFWQAFVPYNCRALPDRRFVDMTYPACWWTNSDGLNRGAVAHWFGHIL